MVCARQSLAAAASYGRLVRRLATSGEAKYDNLLVEQRERVGLVRLNRPKALNALNNQLVNELCHVMEAFDKDPGIGAMVLTGSDRAFAAGADIKEITNLTFSEAYRQDKFGEWSRLVKIRKPVS